MLILYVFCLHCFCSDDISLEGLQQELEECKNDEVSIILFQLRPCVGKNAILDYDEMAWLILVSIRVYIKVSAHSSVMF